MSELEEQFFDTFGIKSKMGCAAYKELGEAKADLICNDYCPECDYLKEVYPQITDRMLLELICLNGTYLWGIQPSTVNELKNVSLEKYIEHANLMADENEKQEFIHQVQALFKENND